ncbi:hypothetical protein P280DRAFT_207468 [Massarina eburnea CBS 473.64]|uniref:C2H2-type domain-containing protein n=1 Tax=Massarina eburnea CBS 473.64 TaxID=1395130 RepID=A0A6A6RID8_9PLEO|nr:hypothetical protein P280DRAFT_207468 [Massarina eburnea CBS 473.64]
MQDQSNKWIERSWPKTAWDETTPANYHQSKPQYGTEEYTTDHGSSGAEPYQASTTDIQHRSLRSDTYSSDLTPISGSGDYNAEYPGPVNIGYALDPLPASNNVFPHQEWQSQGGAQQDRYPMGYGPYRHQTLTSQNQSYYDSIDSGKQPGYFPSERVQGIDNMVPIVPSVQSSPEKSMMAPPRAAMATGPDPDRRPSSGKLYDNQAPYSIRCDACGEVLTGAHANGNLTRHKRSQKCTAPVEKRSYECGLCDGKFQRSDALLTHRRKKHGHPQGQSRTCHTDEY